jgi:FkbM family methyltransferase
VTTLLWKEETEVELTVGNDPTENSIIGIDQSGHKERTKNEATTLTALVDNHDIKAIDYLKLDAEGAEPEVLDGLNPTRVRKAAIDVGPERNGNDTRSDVLRYFEQNEFETLATERMVFARC